MGPKHNHTEGVFKDRHTEEKAEAETVKMKADWSDAATSHGMPIATRSWKR